MRRAERALEVHAHDRVEVVLGHVEDHGVADDPGVVHQDVERAERLDRGVDHLPGRVEVGDVAVVGNRVAAPLLDELHDGVGILLAGAVAPNRAAEVVDHDLGAVLGQFERVAAPDAVRRTGDDGDLPVEQSHASDATSDVAYGSNALWRVIGTTQPGVLRQRHRGGRPPRRSTRCGCRNTSCCRRRWLARPTTSPPARTPTHRCRRPHRSSTRPRTSRSLPGRTAQIRFGTYVYLLGMRHPFVTARAFATLDIVSGGRAEVGVGAGWLAIGVGRGRASTSRRVAVVSTRPSTCAAGCGPRPRSNTAVSSSTSTPCASSPSPCSSRSRC